MKEKSTAAKHMVSQMHKRRKLEAAKVNIKPGPSAAVEGTYTPSTIPSKAKPDMPEASSAKPAGGVQVDLSKMMEGLNTKDHITDDFVSAF